MRRLAAKTAVLAAGVVLSGIIPYALKPNAFNLQQILQSFVITATIAFISLICGLAWRRGSFAQITGLTIGFALIGLAIYVLCLSPDPEAQAWLPIIGFFFALYGLPAAAAGAWVSRH